MDQTNQPPTESNATPLPEKAPIRVAGVGGAGIKVSEHLLAAGMPAAAFIALDSEPRSLAASSAADKVSR